MNTLEKLYDIVDKENIEIDYCNWLRVIARLFKFDEDNYVIAMDKSKIENSTQEKEVLAEELRTLLL